MINNAWKLNEGDRTYQKGWADKGHGASPSKGYAQRASPSKPARATGTLEDAIAKLRSKLAQRGARGFIGMQRQFKIMDDDMSGAIEIQEFKKAIKDFRIEINDEEA